MLTVENLGVTKGSRAILRDVSFALRPGKVTVLLGKNGAGKTTLFRCVNGLQRYSGRTLLEGIPVENFSASEKAKKIGVLPQFLPGSGFTVRTLVSLGRNPYTGSAGRLSAADREAVENAMELVHVQDFADRTVESLSGGEKQRAYLAMLLAQDTPLMLLDEPASSLDTDARRQLLELLRTLADRQNKTLLVILHDLTEAFTLADDVLILADGTCVYSGTAEDCLTTGEPERWFGVRRYTCTEDGESRIFFR